ncbi:MAG: enoyl-CoA hydratase-related protein [Henriciella sp.]|nr:enoyl-CoA hydratase-related protein [Henriciella sp.]
MADYEFVKTETKGHVLIVEMNRPEKMNALHPPANKELGEVFDKFAADKDLWVAVITGAGDRAFSAGNDLRYQAEGGEMFPVPSGFGGLTNRYDLNKPVIAAVNGVAMGGGFEIALACDLIIAADSARFALPEPKVGLAALAGGLHRLPRQIGLKRAMSMILTGRHVYAAEGKELGFVNDVVPQADLMDAAMKWASMIEECSPASIRCSKEVVMKGLDTANFEEAFKAKYEGISNMLKGPDFIEGPLAFAQKRKPNWSGD